MNKKEVYFNNSLIAKHFFDKSSFSNNWISKRVFDADNRQQDPKFQLSNLQLSV